MKLRLLLLFVSLYCMFTLSLWSLTPDECKLIGMRIWHNEGKQQKDKLTWWNEREEFASLGIGHFIWYPPNMPHLYHESFPELLNYFCNRGIIVPEWLNRARVEGCPWKSRDDFFAHINSREMSELREFLFSTVDVQTDFIINRFQDRFSRLLEKLTDGMKTHIKQQIDRLAATPNGMYALIDYLNFKGEGLDPKEEYDGARWGLLQVLELMKGAGGGLCAVEEFSLSAQKVLEARVASAPKHRQEERWLPGWKARLETYCKPL